MPKIRPNQLQMSQSLISNDPNPVGGGVVKAELDKMAKVYQTSIANVAYIYRYGSLVFLATLDGLGKNKSLSGWTVFSLGTIPSGYRPARQICTLLNAFHSVLPLYFRVRPDGEFMIANQSGNTVTIPNSVETSMCWITTNDYPS